MYEKMYNVNKCIYQTAIVVFSTYIGSLKIYDYKAQLPKYTVIQSSKNLFFREDNFFTMLC